jgi:hypothetical protein
LSVPGNKLLTSNTHIDFQWGAVTRGQRYRIQIDNNSNFSSPLVDVTLSANQVTYAANLADSKFYWRVSAVNVSGVAGSWSGARYLTVDTIAPNAPTISKPTDGASVRGVPTSQWNKPSGTVAFQMQFASDPGFSSLLFDSGEITKTSYKPTGFNPLGWIYLQVRGRDAAGNWSSWSPPRGVFIKPIVPVGPGLTSPSNKSTITSSQPTFSWSGVSYGLRYEIQIDNDSKFRNLDAGGVLSDGVLTFTPATALNDARYYWRVRAINSDGEAGAWSSVRQLIVNAIP